MMRRALGVTIVLALSVSASAQQAPVSKSLLEMKKGALAELNKLKGEMLKRNACSEAIDCDNIGVKLMTSLKAMPEKGASSPFPGEKAYDEVLDLWAEAGPALAKICTDAEAELKDKELDEAKLFAGWFETFPDLARGIKHLNRRRKFMKLPAVTQDWSASIGGYLHGIYLKVNKDQPSFWPSALVNSTVYWVLALSADFAQKQIGLFLSRSSSSTGFLSGSSRRHCGPFGWRPPKSITTTVPAELTPGGNGLGSSPPNDVGISVSSAPGQVITSAPGRPVAPPPPSRQE